MQLRCSIGATTHGRQRTRQRVKWRTKPCAVMVDNAAVLSFRDRPTQKSGGSTQPSRPPQSGRLRIANRLLQYLFRKTLQQPAHARNAASQLLVLGNPGSIRFILHCGHGGDTVYRSTGREEPHQASVLRCHRSNRTMGREPPNMDGSGTPCSPQCPATHVASHFRKRQAKSAQVQLNNRRPKSSTKPLPEELNFANAPHVSTRNRFVDATLGWGAEWP